MKKIRKQWIRTPIKPSRVPDFLKEEVSVKSVELVEKYIKPEHVKPPPKKSDLNYLVDIYTKWRGRYFYFMAKYATPGPNRIAPFFDTGFARLEYAGDDRFHLAYFRHTGQWWQIYSNLILDEALDLIKNGGHFQP